jgi:hypothetical protein
MGGTVITKVAELDENDGWADRDRRVFDLAWKHLLAAYSKYTGRGEEDLRRYLASPDRPESMNGVGGIYHFLLRTAQNFRHVRNSISGAMGGSIDPLGAVLFDFDPSKVNAYYGSDADRLLNDVFNVILRDRKPEDASKTWHNFARAALESAEFLSNFGTAAAFFEWADRLYAEPGGKVRMVNALVPIHTIGPALSRDFLKEIGYVGFGKPDTLIIDIFGRAGLSSSTRPEAVASTFDRMAEACGVSSFVVDKVFWLLRSGRFDEDGGVLNGWRAQVVDGFLAELALDDQLGLDQHEARSGQAGEG